MVINNKQHKNQTKYRLIKKLRTFSLLSTLMLISSCAVYKTGFECPAGQGEGCKSVTEVNEMVSRGEIGRNISVFRRDVTLEVRKTRPQDKSKEKQLESKEQRQADTEIKTKLNSQCKNKYNAEKAINLDTQIKTQKTKKECRC